MQLGSFKLLERDFSAILTSISINHEHVSVTKTKSNKYNILRKNIKGKDMESTSYINPMTRTGRLKIQCFRSEDYIPIDGAKITVRGMEGTEDLGIVDLVTNKEGLTQEIDLTTPPLEYSLDIYNDKMPYSLYDITVEKNGFNPIVIKGCQVLPTQTAFQICNLTPSLGSGDMKQEVINVPPNVLYGNYPPKIPEEENKSLPSSTSGVILSQPVIPEYIIVHQGDPNDASAQNYKVPFKDYIKNVASCEVYSTWSNSALRANIFCIISFTLNRIFTEWYRVKGKDFDITSSTAYDQAFSYGRNIYDNISQIVDEIFSTYIRKFGKKQPFLSQYCDGKSVTCPTWLSQWGSQKLGSESFEVYDILTHYYGNDIELVTAKKISGSLMPYPGQELFIGLSSQSVREIQGQLNTISRYYPAIPKLVEDGIYGIMTKRAVEIFQRIFTLPQTGMVDYATWYKISDVLVGVSRFAKLTTIESSRSFVSREFIPPFIPGFDDEKDIPTFYY
ncbi:peptidoglycan-binding protein [Clostridium sp.]|uniref:peptidoglycan-binding domain-containing protein n=1 Tax=Clostridium sp. TaxID=1506 RepID=UPI00345CFFBC